MPPVILVTNDDGVHAAGLAALAAALEDLGDVYVVAPDREQSAVGHALTLHRPLRVTQIAVRWRAVYREAALSDLGDAQRAMQSQRVPHRALLPVGRYHVHVAQVLESGGEGRQPRRVHAVVVGDQDH